MSHKKNTFFGTNLYAQTLHLGTLHKSSDAAVAENILSVAMRCVDFKRMDVCSSSVHMAKILWCSCEPEWIACSSKNHT